MTSSTPLSSWNLLPTRAFRPSIDTEIPNEAIFNSDSSRKTSSLARETQKRGTPSALVDGTPFRRVLSSSAHLSYQDADFSSRDEQFAPPGLRFIELESPEDAFGAELQHLFRSRYFNLTSGVGYFDIDGRIDATLGLDLPPPDGPGPIEVSATTSTDLQHVNVYAYAYINLLKNVTFTVGASVDFLSGDSPDVGDKDQFNPKFGITWNPFPGTTVRAAVFRVLKRTLITDQTLEPTQVAGFNQFFDDMNGTEAWRYGGAIDQKFTKDIFGGVEFSKRDLKVPFLDFDRS